MRAFLISETNDVVTTSVVNDLPTPSAAPGEVVVRVEWSGINFKDSMVVRPKSRVRRSPQLVGGVDAAGTVVESTDPVIAVGAKVVVHGGDLGVARDGGFADFVAAPSRCVNVLPPELTTRTAMILGTAGYTAFASLLALEHHGLKPDKGEVLVTGATGGVGSWSVVALAAAGYDVVASSGSTEAESWLLQQGSRRVIGRNDIGDRLDRVLGSERWAGAIDCVGGETLHQVLRTLRYGAAVAASGLVASADLATTVYPFITRNVALLGIDAVQAEAHTRAATWLLAAQTISGRDIEGLVDSTVSLEGVRDALAIIDRGATRGRILVQVNG